MHRKKQITTDNSQILATHKNTDKNHTVNS